MYRTFMYFSNIWYLILKRESEKKLWRCSDDSKYGAYILLQSEQKFKIQSRFGISNPVIGEGQWYDYVAFHDIICIYELFGNISFLFSMKPILDLCKSLVDAELIYNLLSLALCDILHLLISDWSIMSLVKVAHPHVIIFMLLIRYYILACTS